ncbi:sulfite exporter TauE/SafE family protein [Paenibacillus arenilitoris]|uniref:Probable membrane transporter protein n=1 Tax=Paenibacillus arenilitoris TaxID=2772299 RepID=A0A927CGT2_9BACL|nr:sulfite exporter TauE/SafE family protein [Paenibacillus arenilitoris]MBD2867824.1 sulfite exporter TauE/SafE family protein [Paenibacillus arenilitoris]
MFAVGMLLGFVGAGGSGFILAILTVGFHYPIHAAVGTALAAMAFTSLSGAIGQLRSKNTDVAGGLLVGLTGAAAAYLGSGLSIAISPGAMKWLTGGMLALSSATLWLRLSFGKEGSAAFVSARGFRYYAMAVAVGLITGGLSGTFGIGSTPFIQIGLMFLLGLPMRTAAGTSMLVILPIAAAGAVGYYRAGLLDVPLLLTVLCGTMTGSYIGAKFTKHAPAWLLKTGMIATPVVAALILSFQSNSI